MKTGLVLGFSLVLLFAVSVSVGEADPYVV